MGKMADLRGEMTGEVGPHMTIFKTRSRGH